MLAAVEELLSLPLQDVYFCVLDLETTGSSAKNGGITEIGAVKYVGGEEVARFNTLINPGDAIPPYIVLLTGITDTMVHNAPPIEEVLPELLEFIGTSVLVAHNARFDVGFINAALIEHGRETLNNLVIDTVSLARRLVGSEVPNCKLGTLAASLRLKHQPSHRAINDVLATGDLLHYLIERASGFNVVTLDDLMMLPSLSAHPESAKLSLTQDLPRTPGVYMFVDDAGKILYIGKATNLRSRVRSYFGAGETRKKVGALLKLVKGVHFIETPDPVTAEVLEIRLIGKLRPRYNFVGTRSEKYCYVRLTTDEEWPRLVVTKVPSAKGISVGPISTRTMAREMIEAIESVVPLRRCTVRMGRNYVASPDAPVCSAAQLGLAQCPCSGSADPVSYAEIVQTVADVLTQKSTQVLELLDEKMKAHSAARQFEDAALIRDRIQTINTILRRHRQATALRQEASLTIQAGDVTYELECGVLKATHAGTAFVPSAAAQQFAHSMRMPRLSEDIESLLAMPSGDEGTSEGLVPSQLLDEILCLARVAETAGYFSDK